MASSGIPSVKAGSSDRWWPLQTIIGMLYHLFALIRAAMRNTMNEGLMRHTGRREWEKIHANHVELVSLINDQDIAGAGACMARHMNEAIFGIRTRQPIELPLWGPASLGTLSGPMNK